MDMTHAPTAKNSAYLRGLLRDGVPGIVSTGPERLYYEWQREKKLADLGRALPEVSSKKPAAFAKPGSRARELRRRSSAASGPYLSGSADSARSGR